MHMYHTRIACIPLFVEIEAKSCKDQGKERHKDCDSNRAAVGGGVGFRVSGRNIRSHTQTWKEGEKKIVMKILTALYTHILE